MAFWTALFSTLLQHSFVSQPTLPEFFLPPGYQSRRSNLALPTSKLEDSIERIGEKIRFIFDSPPKTQQNQKRTHNFHSWKKIEAQLNCIMSCFFGAILTIHSWLVRSCDAQLSWGIFQHLDPVDVYSLVQRMLLWQHLHAGRDDVFRCWVELFSWFLLTMNQGSDFWLRLKPSHLFTVSLMINHK